ncbi:MAG: 3-phosphoshikimate 1-carboxyvinyltransferase [Actinobacteria bacterium]|nr:3-phosphoshikimate 1-carboxyvinyltransferase [Actinomycetota bacterium]
MVIGPRITVHPGVLSGELTVPGDKSVGHRALILGALVGHPVHVTNVPRSADVAATARALRTLGAEITLDEAGTGLDGQVTGPLREASDVLGCGNSGTALRLLSGVVAGIDGMAVLSGDDSLRRRPVDRVAVPLRAMGAEVLARSDRFPPLVVRGGGLVGTSYDSPVASAQVKSCVLIAGLAAEGTTVVRSPAPSRDHTERMLAHLGVAVSTSVTDVEEVSVAAGPLRAAPLVVPGDLSSAAFWWVGAAIAGTSVTVSEVGVNPRRVGVLRALEEMGATVSVRARREVSGESTADVTVTGRALARAEIRGQATVDAIDELPVLALAGAMSEDGLEVRDAAELRVKESDRIDALAAAFRNLGLDLQARPDGFRVPGGQRPRGGIVDAAGDHRIAMTAAIAGTVATDPVTVVGADVIATSYPTFLEDLRALGGRVQVQETGR